MCTMRRFVPLFRCVGQSYQWVRGSMNRNPRWFREIIQFNNYGILIIMIHYCPDQWSPQYFCPDNQHQVGEHDNFRINWNFWSGILSADRQQQGLKSLKLWWCGNVTGIAFNKYCGKCHRHYLLIDIMEILPGIAWEGTEEALRLGKSCKILGCWVDIFFWVDISFAG